MTILSQDNPELIRTLLEKHSIFTSWLFASFTFYPNIPFYASQNSRHRREDPILLSREPYERWPFLTALRLKRFFQSAAIQHNSHLHIALVAGDYLSDLRIGETYHYHLMIGIQRPATSEKLRIHLRDKFAGSSKVYDYDSNSFSYPTVYLDVPSTYEANAIYYILGHHNQTLPSTLELNGTYCGQAKRCRRRKRCSFYKEEQLWDFPTEELKQTLVYRLSRSETYYKHIS